MSDYDFTIKIDGKEVPARNGDTILRAALRAGVFIPHYCWHPALTIAGNCRVCLVYATKAGPPDKPTIACNTVAVEGMEVESEGPRTRAAREGVMEFLLINHPLDCPVCDQAGECDLQQYSYDYGRPTSRFDMAKTQRPRKDLGPTIRFVGNRCIVCTRCVRFTEEVAGTGELGVVNRGDGSYIDVFPGHELTNPLSTCVADICPVGALLERDTVHTTRTWLLRGTKSVCGGCATGCNVNVETFDEQVKRITPRENQATNRWWMCDAGRLMYKEALSPTRLRGARSGGEAALVTGALPRALEVAGEGGDVVGLVTGFASNEELFVLKQLVGKGPIAAVMQADGFEFTARDGFHVSKDKNPNRRGVERILGPQALGADAEREVRQTLTDGKVGLAIVLDGVPGGAPWSPELLAALKRARAVLVLSLEDGPAAALATVALPALHWTEKDGTFVTGRGRLQRVRAATPPPFDSLPDLEILQELLKARGAAQRVVSAASIFRRLAAALPESFGGLDYNAVGEVGWPLPGGEDEMTPEQARTFYEAGPVSRDPGRAKDEQTRISVHRESPAGYGTPRGDF